MIAVSSLTTAPAPAARAFSSRDTTLAALFEKAHLLTPPAVAMKVVNAAANPDCRVAEIASLLTQDPALSAKLLRTVNSSIYALPKPVASLERAVMVLGLNPLRSLVLGLSLPIMQSTGPVSESLRQYWISSVGGAILAREFATLVRRPSPDNDLTAGLLRNLGAMLLEQTFPAEWRLVQAAPAERRLRSQCEVEREVFGLDHAEVTAELLTRWNLPAEVIEPIRHHHHPERLAGRPKTLADRAELLRFVEFLIQLDDVTEHPALLAEVLATAETRYNLTAPVLIRFLSGVLPKVDEFARLLNLNVGQRPDFAAILSAGCEEMVKLAVETSPSTHGGDGHFQGSNPTPAQLGWPTRAMPRPHAAEARGTTPPPRRVGPPLSGPVRMSGTQGFGPPRRVAPPPPGGLPDFRPDFVAALPPGGCRLDDYELKKILGRGAMGVVFLGFEPGLRRSVAVKMLAPEMAAVPIARQRFAREARSAAAIRHENVVGIYAVREAAGLSYLGMEFVDGGDLEGRLERDKQLPVAEVIRLARQMAAGLGAAHDQHIVHRDIKPANIMLANPDGKVKLSDFGLARSAEDPSLTTAGALVGSPLYMSPEQVRGQELDGRSDLFSLGSVLYSALIGKPPFLGRHVAAVLHNVCELKPPPPHAIRPEVPAALSAAVMRLLEKEREDRCQTAAEFAAALPPG
jgi:HD-like signal output (HDOD) protein